MKYFVVSTLKRCIHFEKYVSLSHHQHINASVFVWNNLFRFACTNRMMEWKKKPIFQSISYTFMLSKRWMRAIRCGFLFMPWEIKLLSNIFMNMGHCVRCGFNLNIFSAFVFDWTILMDDKEEKTALNRIVYVWTLATVVWFFVYNFDSNE